MARDGRDEPRARPDPLIVVLDEDGEEVGITHLAQLGAPDLEAIDAVARLRLTARRQGWDVRVRGACGPLLALIQLVGMDDLLEVDVPAADSLAGRAAEPPGQSSR